MRFRLRIRVKALQTLNLTLASILITTTKNDVKVIGGFYDKRTN